MSGALREVREEDLPALYEQHKDPESVRMAGTPVRERADFIAHWKKNLADSRNVNRIIEIDGRASGHVVAFPLDGVPHVGYWVAREHWGRGAASFAVAELLKLVTARPQFARVARHNAGSRRVLEKNGFVVCGEEPNGFILRLG